MMKSITTFELLKRFAFLLLFSSLAGCVTQSKDIQVSSAPDLMLLDANELNWSTLYVVGNDDGYVTYIEYLYEHGDKGLAYDGLSSSYAVAILRFGEEGKTNLDGPAYSIDAQGKTLSPEELEIGDKLHCHHDYQSELMDLPTTKTVYALYSFGEKWETEITDYIGYPSV